MTKRTDHSTTGIEWTDHTWNPFAGCTIHTAGCTNCYAMRQAHRIEHNYKLPHYRGVTKKVNGRPVWTGKINLASERALRKPYTIRCPSLIFVNSMSDFFHENARDEWRLRVLDIIRETPHEYQLLTKRPENIAPFLKRTGTTFPNNAWIGATVEHRKTRDRINILRDIPAAIRFLSIEPLIAPGLGQVDLTGIHWVIIGGESGPGAREMNADWVREVRDQCITANIPLFFKQWGKPESNPLFNQAPPNINSRAWLSGQDPLGKGGSLLDGRHWKEFPHAQNLI